MPHSTTEGTQHERFEEPLAIVGMSCTLAGGVDSPSAMWETLVNKKINQSAKVPESRFNVDAYFHDKAFGRPSAIGSKGGYFLDTELHAFDAEFFKYDADEAKHMDPQHFRILESAYECLESAGRSLDDVRGTNTAVYIGNFSLDQVIKSARHSYDDRHLHEVIGVDPGLLSSRVSYCFDLKGPVFTTNTGCTSSLFALHTAAMALRSGQTQAAIVGGVNLLQGPEAYSSYSKFGIMSADSMCHSYDARCNGYVRGEGVGALYVRRLSDAIKDNDPIRGVIRSIAVNNNGTVPGVPMFVPNKDGLEGSLKLAYSQAQLDPYDTAYVETHGIGMVIGEIAESHAVGLAMNEPRKRDSPMLLGSLKPNFGHQEAASGVFVLMKAALMTEIGVIPGHANFQSAHPAIDMEKLNIKPQTETISWPEGYAGRRVGISSYGWSGTNCHGIVENIETLHPDYQLGGARDKVRYNHATSRPLLLAFSAHKDTSLRRNIAKICEVADRYYAADLVYTINCRRSKLSQRAFAVVTPDGNISESQFNFGAIAKGEGSSRIGFEFTDSDVDLRNLLKECFENFPSFATVVHKLNRLLKRIDSKLPIEGLHNGLATPVGALSKQQRIAVQIALIDLLAEWNVKPTYTSKKSGGELVAAYAAGVLSAAEALLFSSCTGCVPENLPEITELGRKNLAEAAGGLASDDWQNPSIPMVSSASVDVAGDKPDVILQFGSGYEVSNFACVPESEPSTIKAGIDNLSALLDMAGRLFLQGHPVDLKKVNLTGAESWQPSLLVDLPPYQWDHSQSYSSETYANREHRLNGHAYHDLLGRRVYGLSPQTLIWKNKLSFQILPDSIPWIFKELPQIEHGAASFISMIYEAMCQAHEKHSVANFIVSELEVLNTLRYKDDSPEIELQTSFTRLSSKGAKRPAYRVVIESVKNAVWTTHAEATVDLDLDASSPAMLDDVVNGTAATERETKIDLGGKFSEALKCPSQLQPFILEACIELLGKAQPARIAEVRVHMNHTDSNIEMVVKVAGQDAKVTDKAGNRVLSLKGVE